MNKINWWIIILSFKNSKRMQIFTKNIVNVYYKKDSTNNDTKTLPITRLRHQLSN